MSKKKSLSSICTYDELLVFVRSNAALNITDEDAVHFYINEPEHWKQALLSVCQPSPEVEKVIVNYSDGDTVRLLCRLHGLYPQTIEWAMRDGTPDVAEVVVKHLEERPDSKIDELTVRRREPALRKLYVKKFGSLEDDAERVLNEDHRLNSLLQLYIDLQS